MNRSLKILFMALLWLNCFGLVFAQSSTGSISGTVTDERQSVITGATVTAKNVDTGFSRSATSDGEGRYRFVNLPTGSYEITIESTNFAKYVQTGIILVVNQDAVINAALRAGGVAEVVTVAENASVLNTTTAEVSTRFDERRLSELPIATNRNVFNVLLSVPGISQLSSGQTSFANGISFSSNGGRLRSNNFMLDGQDINDPSVAGGQVGLNNPDAIGEVRIITNQFLAEYGRNSGAVVNFIGKSGTNDFHGSGFIFHNNENLNSCSNLDKGAGFCNPAATVASNKKAPLRKEFQYGFTVGGPLISPWFGNGGDPYFWKGTDKTFFFGDFQKWTDRRLGSGTTLRGAPTEAGRAILQSAVGTRPQVAALLRFLPAGTANGQSRTFTANGQTYTVPLGDLTGSSAFSFDSKQGAVRIDHRFNEKNLLYGRYRFDWNTTAGSGQVTPTGLTTVNDTKVQAATTVLNTVVTSNLSNEARLAWTRYSSTTNAADPSSLVIPSIEITDLGLTGFNAAASRTAIGLAVNLPQFRVNDTYQITDSLTYIIGNHALKFGVDLRRTDVKSFFIPTTRGRLAYSSLQTFVDDNASTATINAPLRGGDIINFYRWREYYTFVQDEWRVSSNFSLTLGLRYEWPGDSFSYLKEANKRIVALNGNDPRYALNPVPRVDKNNFMPRIGFNWSPRTSDSGILGFITGGDKLVLRGGYSRTYDANYINLNLNVAGGFPFLASITFGDAGQPSATPGFVNIQNFTTPNVSNPNSLTRTVVAEDFRAPATDQYSFEVQRELTRDTVFKIGYIRTKGTGLFQTVDGNPRTACAGGNTVVTTPQTIPLLLCPRVDPTRGVIRLRGNRANSTYNALQTSLEKRLSNSFSAGLHYTYSSFIDTASETFNPSNAEVAVAQNSFDLANDRSRSSFDRPHRLSGNFVYELPFFRSQSGFAGHLLGGFQVNSFFSIQSGAPFTVLNGSDPTGALSGIDGLVGNSIRPNLASNTDLSSLTIPEIRALCGTPTTGTFANRCPNLFTRLVQFQRVGNAGRNIIRAQKYFNVDFGVIKNTRITENIRMQLRADMFNVLNERNFGVPEGRVNAANFLDQWGTDGGNRRIILGARLVF
ncbi:MAG: TonB-dependent receptor [Acidobacteria bacterium]|nr:TonB-dependent receptor [Acidobacteriota bacterium]